MTQGLRWQLEVAGVGRKSGLPQMQKAAKSAKITRLSPKFGAFAFYPANRIKRKTLSLIICACCGPVSTKNFTTTLTYLR